MMTGLLLITGRSVLFGLILNNLLQRRSISVCLTVSYKIGEARWQPR